MCEKEKTECRKILHKAKLNGPIVFLILTYYNVKKINNIISESAN